MHRLTGRIDSIEACPAAEGCHLATTSHSLRVLPGAMCSFNTGMQESNAIQVFFSASEQFLLASGLFMSVSGSRRKHVCLLNQANGPEQQRHQHRTGALPVVLQPRHTAGSKHIHARLLKQTNRARTRVVTRAWIRRRLVCRISPA